MNEIHACAQCHCWIEDDESFCVHDSGVALHTNNAKPDCCDLWEQGMDDFLDELEAA